MRTSPPGMRRPWRRAPLLPASILVLVVVLGAACSDDGGDDGTSPTTTSPATTTEAPDDDGGGDGGEATTTAPPDDEPASTTEAEPTGGTGPVPGADAEPLTADQARAQLQALLAEYRQAIVDTRAAGTVDERTLRALSRALTTDLANGQLDGLRDPARINATVPELVPTDVELLSATGTCAGGTVVIDTLDQVFVGSPAVDEPYWFRLEPAAAGASAPAWRIAVLHLGDDGQPLEEAMCE